MTLDELRKVFLTQRAVEHPIAPAEPLLIHGDWHAPGKEFDEMFLASHLRPNGTKCPYMAETFCNKCGWMKDAAVPAKDADLIEDEIVEASKAEMSDKLDMWYKEEFKPKDKP